MSKPGNGAKLYVPDNSEISFWTFHHISGDRYYLTAVVDGSTKYLQITGSGVNMVSEPDENCRIQVVPGTGSHAGQIYLRQGTNTLAYSGNIEQGFKVGGTAGLEWLNLVEESELDNTYFMTYSAQKVSVSDESVTNGSRVIVYTRVWNDTTKKYEFYAVDHDGSLVRCYESGDSIEWVGGRLNSMLWNFVEHYWEGTTDPNGYYELYNQYSEKYIAPQKSSDQVLADAPIGINMSGRQNGKYYSPIVAWDDGYYAYAGLKVEGGRVVSCPISEADDFYFAIVEDMPVDDELHTVPTVDHKQYGITMKMVNFPGNNDSARQAMSNFLGSDNGYKKGNTEPALLNTGLGEDGYPVTKAGNSFSDWFAGADEVNHLFIGSTYSGTGYFEYDSTQNFAHLDESTNNFVVYKELAASASSGQFHDHGHFWPYNDIEAGKFATNKNLRDALGRTLPDSDPRKYEKLYAVQKSNTEFAPDYYMGMEVSATFTQTPDGLDDWGHDIIYEFTGDDDFWLFVDGELIIDLGGIHDALPGSVNYRTGDVYVNGKHYTLRGLFESNYKKRNPGASDQEVAEWLSQYFDEGSSIFKDYSTHTMKIYYLERGAGASNLHMRFKKYMIYEAELTDPVVDQEGKVISYDSLRLIDEGESVSLKGKQQGDTVSDDFLYTVNYKRGELSTNDNVRVDEATNSRPGIVLKKTEWDGTTPLAGASYVLADEQGTEIGTYISGEDGLITEAYLRENVVYTLTETAAPQGWHGLESVMNIKLRGGEVTVTGVDEDYYIVTQGTGTEKDTITIKDRPYRLRAVKVDSETKAPLANVGFKLYRQITVDNVEAWDPNPYPGYENLLSGADGVIFDVNTLPAGTYQLRESAPISGYQALSGHITFTVSKTGSVVLTGTNPPEAEFSSREEADGSILYTLTLNNVRTQKVSLWKTDMNSTSLTGAEFSLYKAEDYDDASGKPKEGAHAVIAGAVGRNSLLQLGELAPGEYRLIETKAPEGYVTIDAAIHVTVRIGEVVAMKDVTRYNVYRKGDDRWVEGQDDDTLQIQVTNSSGEILPMTGGAGTGVIYLTGIILIGLVAAGFARKKV